MMVSLGRWQGYGVAILLVGAATLIQLSFEPVVHDQYPYLPYLLVLTITGWACGRGGSILCLTLGALATSYFFVESRGSLAIREPGHILGMAMFLVVGVAMVIAFDRLEVGRRRLLDSESELCRDRALFRAVLSSITDPVHVCARDGSVIFSNAAAERVLAGPITTWSGDDRRSSVAYYCSDGRTPMAAGELPMALAVRGEATDEVEMVVRAPGSPDRFVLRAKPSPIVDERGEHLGGVVHYRDVTALKEMEDAEQRTAAALVAGESRFQAFMDHSPAAAWMKDEEGRYTFVNRTTLAMMRWDRDAILGKTDHELLPHLADDFRASERGILESGMAEQLIEHIALPDGTVATMLNVKFPFVDQENRRHVGGIGVNITPVEKAEQAMRTSEADLARAQAAVHLGSWRWDLARDEVTWSAEMFRIFGVDPRTFSPSHEAANRLIHPDDRDRHRDLVDEALEGRPVAAFECRVVRPGGEERVVQSSRLELEFDEHGQPVSLLGTILDITERKEAELERLKSRAKLEAVLASMTDAVFLTDTEGRFLDFNEACATYHRFPGKAECTTLAAYPGLFEVYLPDGTPARLDQWAVPRALRGETVTNAEYTVRRKDSGETWIGSYSFGPIRDATGAIVGSVVTARDVTEQKRALAELRDSEAKFRAYVEQAADAFLVTDFSGRFLEVSAQACESLGYSREELLRMSIFDIEQDVDLDRAQAVFRELVLGKPTTVKGHHRRKDGSVFPVEIRIGSFTRGAECIYLASMRDITERERAEAALRESLLFRREAEKIGRIGAWKVNPATDYLYWTEGVYEILGAPHDYHPGLAEGLKFYDADSIPILEEALRRALTDGTPFVFETGLTTWTGGHIWTEVRGLGRITDGGQSYVMGTFLDITERRQAEQSLRDQEALLKEMGHIAQVGGWEMDAQTLEVSWTDEVARIHDLDPHVVPDKQLSLSCYPGDSRARLESALRDALEGGKPYDLELEFRSAAGVHKWVRTIGQPVWDGDRVVKLRGTLQDITSRIEAETTLRESEERFRTLFETMVQGVVYQDATGAIISANPAAERILGLTIDEMKGRTSLDPDWKAIHEDGSNFHGEDHPAMVALRSGMAIYDVVMGIRHPAQGRYRWISVNAIPQSASGGCRPHRVYTTFEDITERRQAEEEVRTLNRELERRVAERTADVRNMVAVIDSSTDFIAAATPDGRPLWENEAFRSLTGIQPSGPRRPETIAALHPPGSAGRILQEGIPAAIRDGHWEGETEVRASDGRAVPVSQLIMAHRGEDGGLAFVSTIMRDITERKRLETAILEQSHELARANAELLSSSRHKDEFLANMSHELRTPLTGILGISEGMLEGVYGPLNEGQRRSLADVQECGRHLLSLINDILDVAKIEAGMVALEKGPVDVRSICHASARFLKDAAHKKSITVEVAIDEALETVDADERRLKQILVNLLSNAVKFSAQGGRVGLQVEADAGRRQARFTVRDTGIGISPEGLRALFKPFMQLDAGLARGQGGTGLGLVLVKRLTELHGGALDVSSVPGEGSRFTVVLSWDPAEDAQHRQGCAYPVEAIAQPGVDDGPSPGTSGPRILIVDDNQVSVRALKEFLRFKGYVVEAADDGEDGIARARANCPDLILMDIQMPGMDGLEAIRRLRELPRLGETPIVALTAMAMRGDRERVLAAGATDYASKPASITELHRRISQLLSREEA